MSGVTFGSVGDIIAVGQIAWNIAKALSSTRGSAKKYQSLIKDLELFKKRSYRYNRISLNAYISN